MKKLFLLSFLFVISSCVTRVTDFTVISTKNTNVQAKKGTRVRGEDCTHLLFGFIPMTGTMNPNLKEAIDRTIEKGSNADVLLDGVVYNRFFYIPLVYLQSCYEVEGTFASTNK